MAGVVSGKGSGVRVLRSTIVVAQDPACFLPTPDAPDARDGKLAINTMPAGLDGCVRDGIGPCSRRGRNVRNSDGAWRQLIVPGGRLRLSPRRPQRIG